jgi:hypothetical protein
MSVTSTATPSRISNTPRMRRKTTREGFALRLAQRMKDGWEWARRAASVVRKAGRRAEGSV